jgi:hypothetical protein
MRWRHFLCFEIGVKILMGWEIRFSRWTLTSVGYCAAVKTFYLILSNLRFRTISRIGFERRTIAKTRSDPSNKNFCPILGLDRVGLSDMSETQLCGQSIHDRSDIDKRFNNSEYLSRVALNLLQIWQFRTYLSIDSFVCHQ